MDWRRHLLWIDCTAGGAVGALVLALHGWLSGLYGLPERFVFAMGIANLAYAAYSFSLARRRQRPEAAIRRLAGANVAWAAFLLAVVPAFAPQATAFGIATLVAEAAFVGGLGVVEWRNRARLAHA